MNNTQNVVAHHPLLLRQLRRAGIVPGSSAPVSSASLENLLNKVSESYYGAQEEHELLEHSLDISSREMHALNTRLENERNRLNTLLNTMEDCVCTLDGKGYVVWGNPAALRLLGLPPANLTGEGSFVFFEHLELMHEEECAAATLEKNLRYRRALLRSGAGLHTPISYLVNEIVQTDDGGRESSVVVFRDITVELAHEKELRDAHESAKTASKAKSELLANVSHEVRTPLHGILGMAQLLLIEGGLNVAQTSYLRNLQSSAHGLLHILNDILDLSKIEAGRLSLELLPFSPDAILNEVRQTIQSQAVAKELELRFRVEPPAPPSVIGDPTRIRQIVLNLASNAVKFTEHGFVELSLQWNSGDAKLALHFQVRDSGIGIPPEKHKAIFEAFSQADSSITRRFGGTGLGLAICARLAQMMDGQLIVESEPGRGSIFGFSIHLPLAAESQTEPGVGPSPVQLPPLRILYAEDNTINQLTGRKILRAKGHFVQIVSTGKAAVQAAKQLKYDLILMDHQMPEMSGIEASEAIRKMGCNIPIIAASADAMPEDRERFSTAGMDGFVGKPFTLAELESEITRVLSIRCPDILSRSTYKAC